MFFVNIAVVFLLFGVSSAQVDQPIKCLNITGADYDFYQGVGLWYIYASTYDPFEDAFRCLTHYWFYPAADNVARVVVSGIFKRTGLLSQIEVVYTLYKPDNRLHSKSLDPLRGVLSHDLYDLEDVYEDYIITSSCMRQGSSIVPTFTILTREPYPTTDVIRRAREVITGLGLAEPNFFIYDTNCE
ncbi:uncharacterized protein LOC123262893 [Cotesia glomerata]|uniref:Uncharacterized protein n=1 Tax=Cotesia glomerata TaxID=32391 RepID=A0AAV7IQ60_COTGL|nr:uncharacterized protein LOC123262893 [Cotesia glomerata]KAH0555009.1 hypothetical protein KQX54_014657 [Cotesia glomerata]